MRAAAMAGRRGTHAADAGARRSGRRTGTGRSLRERPDRRDRAHRDLAQAWSERRGQGQLELRLEPHRRPRPVAEAGPHPAGTTAATGFGGTRQQALESLIAILGIALVGVLAAAVAAG